MYGVVGVDVLVNMVFISDLNCTVFETKNEDSLLLPLLLAVLALSKGCNWRIVKNVCPLCDSFFIKVHYIFIVLYAYHICLPWDEHLYCWFSFNFFLFVFIRINKEKSFGRKRKDQIVIKIYYSLGIFLKLSHILVWNAFVLKRIHNKFSVLAEQKNLIFKFYLPICLYLWSNN